MALQSLQSPQTSRKLWMLHHLHHQLRHQAPEHSQQGDLEEKKKKGSEVKHIFVSREIYWKKGRKLTCWYQGQGRGYSHLFFLLVSIINIIINNITSARQQRGKGLLRSTGGAVSGDIVTLYARRLLLDCRYEDLLVGGGKTTAAGQTSHPDAGKSSHSTLRGQGLFVNGICYPRI
jgi:hypothetical protein